MGVHNTKKAHVSHATDKASFASANFTYTKAK